MDQDRLVMSAHVVGDPGVTELRVRLLAGTFRCSGKVSADAQSSYPLTLRLALRRSDGTTSTLTEMSLNPGQASDLNQTFKVDAPGTELSIRCALPAGAANNYNAKIYFDNLVLESVTKAD